MSAVIRCQHPPAATVQLSEQLRSRLMLVEDLRGIVACDFTDLSAVCLVLSGGQPRPVQRSVCWICCVRFLWWRSTSSCNGIRAAALWRLDYRLAGLARQLAAYTGVDAQHARQHVRHRNDTNLVGPTGTRPCPRQRAAQSGRFAVLLSAIDCHRHFKRFSRPLYETV